MTTYVNEYKPRVYVAKQTRLTSRLSKLWGIPAYRHAGLMTVVAAAAARNTKKSFHKHRLSQRRKRIVV